MNILNKYMNILNIFPCIIYKLFILFCACIIIPQLWWNIVAYCIPKSYYISILSFSSCRSVHVSLFPNYGGTL